MLIYAHVTICALATCHLASGGVAVGRERAGERLRLLVCISDLDKLRLRIRQPVEDDPGWRALAALEPGDGDAREPGKVTGENGEWFQDRMRHQEQFVG